MRKSVTRLYGRRASSVERPSLSSGSHGKRTSSGDRSSMTGGPLRVNTDSNRKSGIPQHQRKLSTGSSQYAQCSTNGGNRQNSMSRYSFFGSQQQKNRLSRGSGMGMRGHTGVTKDPRPTSNKTHQQQCIKDLIMFLTERQYPHSLSPKLLQSPSCSDFMKIFEFIYSFLDPKCSIARDDVPKVFKQMGYPFTITKSSMCSVGSPHTWPTLLAGLDWLIDLIKLGLSGDIESTFFPTGDEFDTIPETKILFDYTEQTYQAYMAGQDTFEDLDDKLAVMISEKYCGTAGGIDALEMEHKRLRTELELLENDMDKLKGLQESRDILKLDDERYMEHLSKIEAHRLGLEKQYVEAEAEFNEAVVDAKCADSNRQRMGALLDEQKLSQADVERIKLNGRELQRQRQEMERRENDIDQDIWQRELELAKEHEKLERHCTEYNKLAQKLKLIPLSAENSYGIDYELKPSYQGYMDSRFKDTIKPALLQLKKQCSASQHTKATERMQAQESLEQVVEYVNELQDDINMQESRSKRLGDELECKKQVFQREFQQAQQEIETLQRELMELQNPSMLGVQDASRDMRNAHKMYELKKQEIVDTEKAYCVFTKRSTDLVTIHMEAVQGRLQDLCEESEQTLLHVRREAQETEEICRKLQPPS